jgi:MFS superfamily sulfate permease-like transporter
VSATTATSALSAAAVGPLADGDPLRYAALSAALGLLAGVVLVLGGLLGLGAVSDFVSKPVMTGFVFGLGLVVMEGQLDALIGDNVTTVGVGVTCIAILLAFKFVRPGWPAMSLVVAGAIVVSWALNRSRRRGRGRDPARAARPGVAGRQRRGLRRAAADGVRRADPLHRGRRCVTRARRAAPL